MVSTICFMGYLEGYLGAGLCRFGALSTELAYLSIAFGEAKEPEIVYFTIKTGAKEPGNPQNHRSVIRELPSRFLYVELLHDGSVETLSRVSTRP